MNISYEERANNTFNVVGKKLFHLMAEKKTNVGFSANVHSCQLLLDIVEEIGPHIVLVKTHVDILEDFTPEFPKRLQALAHKHRFLIFEDRKFSDNGQVVAAQYSRGLYRIVEWADLVNVHAFAGPGVIQDLEKTVGAYERGLLVIAEKSELGDLFDESYIRETVRWAEASSQFVCGFICSRRLSFLSSMLNITPGIHRLGEIDIAFQGYITPATAIKQKQSDIILVGRGIYASNNPLKETVYYQEEAWKAYKETLKL